MTQPPEHQYLPPADTGLDLLFQDRFLLVVDKASGLLTVPGRGAAKQDSLALRVQGLYPDAEIVHRLDMDTSGLVVLARGKAMQRELGRLFQNREVRKAYIALVAGRVVSAEGTIELPLLSDWPRRPLQKVDPVNGKRAITHYRLLEYNDHLDTTRLQLLPETGRTHQLRVHLQQLGHPILGDRLYGDVHPPQRVERLCLHASELGFRHPGTGEELHFRSELPF